jgi:hypothetical protein
MKNKTKNQAENIKNSNEKLLLSDVMPSFPLSELKKILWNTRLSKKQVEKNNKDEMKFDYNQGWTDAINKIISKVKWQ